MTPLPVALLDFPIPEGEFALGPEVELIQKAEIGAFETHIAMGKGIEDPRVAGEHQEKDEAIEDK